MILAFLQNPHGKNSLGRQYVGRKWPRHSWPIELHRSRTGQRTRVLIDTVPDIRFENTTPVVGDDPASVLPPDLRHIRRVLRKHKPRAVIAMDRQAAEALEPIFKPLVVVPHPTYRVVTNELYRVAGDRVRGAFEGVV